MKKFSFILSSLVALTLGVSSPALANNDVNVKVGGDQVDIQPKPYISNEVTYIPLRDMFETLDASVVWNDKERYVMAKNNERKLKLFVDVNDAFINDQPFVIENRPKVKDGRVFVPLRFVSETFGAKVDWNEGERSIDLYLPKKLAAYVDSVHKELNVESTAYHANCAGCSGITSTGINLLQNPEEKVIAVDPNVIPLGSKVWVEGYGIATAGDIGSAIKGNKVDVFIPNPKDALAYGRKNITVKVLK